MQDHYKILGVDRNATPDTIKKAYRKLASLYHPDKEGGSKTKFQEVEAAYRTLSDPNLRAQYDNPSPFGNMGGGFQGFGRQDTPFDFETIFDIFGARFQHPHHTRLARMTLWITLADSVKGGRRTVSVGTHQGTMTVEIEIPVGINDGDAVQYSGIGPGGSDLVITFRLHPDPRFQRQGQNLIMDQAVVIWDLVVGNEIKIRDILGNYLTLTIPPRTQPNTIMRLRERGVPNRSGAAGDLLVRLQATLPDSIPPDLLALIEQNRTQ